MYAHSITCDGFKLGKGRKPVVKQECIFLLQSYFPYIVHKRTIFAAKIRLKHKSNMLTNSRLAVNARSAVKVIAGRHTSDTSLITIYSIPLEVIILDS